MFDYYNEKLKDWKQPTYKFKPKWFVAVRDLSDAKAAESSSSDGTGRKMKRVDLSNKHLVYDVYGNLKLTLKDINAQQVRQLIVIPEPIREWRMPDKTVLKYTPYSKTYNPPREKKALTSDSEFINSEADEDWDEDWDEEYYNGEYDDEHDPSGRGFNASAVDFRDDQSITSDTSSILTPSETSGTDTETASTHSFSSSSVSSSSLTSDSERSDSGDDSSSSVVISRLSESSQLSDSSAAEDSDEQESI